MTISIEADQRGLVIRTPYSSMFVSELKRLIPASDRQFDGSSKAWIVAPHHSSVIQKLIMTVYKEAVHIPVAPQKDNKLRGVGIRVEYVGQCKQRADGTVSAYGHDGQAWSVILPETALRAFFNDSDVEINLEGDKKPVTASSTLYAALLVKPEIPQSEIAKAYKRMSRLVHPDVNHEPDAHEQFLAVKKAYEVLSDVTKRKRYDAGLALEASYNKGRANVKAYYESFMQYFRSPLRCGLLIVDGERKLSRVIVSRIHSWNDITDEQGRTLVTSWPFGAETFERMWV